MNATLLQKGGFISQVMAGAYTYLPLGLRVLSKIEQVVREEMDKLGTEILMPALSPQEMWRKTGRLETIDVMFEARGGNELSRKINGASYVLNSTHEDVISAMTSGFSTSYKDLPFALYQIQTKFRNEPRPKGGLLRGREFRMKDLYSFHASLEDFEKYYAKAQAAYRTVYERLGLGTETIMAAASGRPFTDGFSHEFQTFNESGEDLIFIAEKAGVSFNKEIAPSQAPLIPSSDEQELPLEEVEGVGIIGVEELANYLKIPTEKTTKTILFETAEGDVIAAAVRGTYEINEEKLSKIVKTSSLTLASEETVRRVTRAEVGYAGILNLPETVRIFMDESMKGRKNFECGANRTNYHSINVNFGRDIEEPEQFYDIKTAREGDLYPETGELYTVRKTSEVGNIFPLGTKYADAFEWTYTDDKGKPQPIFMGSYGIGTSRIMGVLVEKFHDERGIVWPAAVAPFTVHLVALNLDDEGVAKRAEEVYAELQEAGVDVLFDDRLQASPGVKLGDADLIGCPWRFVVSRKTEDQVEVKARTSAASEHISLEAFLEKVK